MSKSRLTKLEAFIGKWNCTISNTWFLDSPDTELTGTSSFEWFENGFVLWRFNIDADIVPDAVFIIGFSSSVDKFETFYYDVRGISRIFDTAFDGQNLTMLRKDPDFFQSIKLQVNKDSITGVSEASDDKGNTWRKDFDLLFTRVQE